MLQARTAWPLEFTAMSLERDEPLMSVLREPLSTVCHSRPVQRSTYTLSPLKSGVISLHCR
ncbi:hypothetical protein Mterra_03611 [Calidithermus terrae]|uniref:Uncharacterized protein n=1 Tax=Calidithermus terrae TaxID=1408545 RepID=A0A399E3M5_9DEIN|nr:hypothetical protein Mterra_03611 [Calidithermus terrae]